MSSGIFGGDIRPLDQTRRRQDFRMNIEWAFANFVGAPGAVCHHSQPVGAR